MLRLQNIQQTVR